MTLNWRTKKGDIVFIMAINDEPIAFMVMADTPKKEARKTIQHLKQMAYQVAMLTRDNKFTAAQLGIERVYSQVAIKYEAGVIRRLKKQESRRR